MLALDGAMEKGGGGGGEMGRYFGGHRVGSAGVAGWYQGLA